ncbi:diguanylate cyclase, partial [Bacillus paranthracis]|nr:diguanylate cyclase [Bacillus paranthracis]
MKQYIFYRFLQMIPILIGTSFLIFVLFALLPGDYIDSNPKLTPERAQELRELYGLDKPILERYVRWFTDLVKGDFG